MGGIIVFGSLMGAMFIGQQFLQDVLGYSTVDAGLAILPAAFFMIIVAPRSAKMVEARGARFTLLAGYLFVLLGFIWMLLLLERGHPLLAGRRRLFARRHWRRPGGHACLALADSIRTGDARRHGVGHGGPAARPGRRAHAVDLRRAAGSGLRNVNDGGNCGDRAGAARFPPLSPSELTMSYAGAQAMATSYPQYADQITAAAKTAFLAGDTYAYIAGIIAVLIGAALVFFFFPKRDREREVLLEYHQQDMAALTAGSTQRATTAK